MKIQEAIRAIASDLLASPVPMKDRSRESLEEASTGNSTDLQVIFVGAGVEIVFDVDLPYKVGRDIFSDERGDHYLRTALTFKVGYQHGDFNPEDFVAVANFFQRISNIVKTLADRYSEPYLYLLNTAEEIQKQEEEFARKQDSKALTDFIVAYRKGLRVGKSSGPHPIGLVDGAYLYTLEGKSYTVNVTDFLGTLTRKD